MDLKKITAEEVIAKIEQHGISFFPVHYCSMCGYLCGYVIEIQKKRVAYDRGCNCTTYRDIEESSIDDIVNLYNMQSSEKSAIRKFWNDLQTTPEKSIS